MKDLQAVALFILAYFIVCLTLYGKRISKRSYTLREKIQDAAWGIIFMVALGIIYLARGF